MKELLYTIILLGAIQGIIVGFLLFFSGNNRSANRLLAVIICLITLPGIHLYFHYRNWFDISKAMEMVHAVLPMVVIMPIGPLIYFYIRVVLEPGFRTGKRQWMHFWPTIIDLLPKFFEITFLVGATAGWLAPDRAPWTRLVDTYSLYADIPRWISLTIYIILSARYLRAHHQMKDAAAYSNQASAMSWLRQFIRLFTAFQLIWLIYLVPYILPQFSNRLIETLDWFPVYLPLAILIYWLGFKGYALSQQTNRRINSITFTLPEKVVDSALGLLKESMESGRLYLDPGLSLTRLAAETGIPAKTISAVLNQYMKVSFNEFVNSYRVEEFKQRIGQPEGDRLTIAGMANECGFNSPSSFQRIFKQMTGLSPTEFRKTAVGIK
ncbi:MAG TPA: helix-turn-helix domain-containing protein [Chryseolinea sp.]|nr:helix-turn-helix domain-containing protein [Chryseolinea sp.]